MGRGGAGLCPISWNKGPVRPSGRGDARVYYLTLLTSAGVYLLSMMGLSPRPEEKPMKAWPVTVRKKWDGLRKLGPWSTKQKHISLDGRLYKLYGFGYRGSRWGLPTPLS